MPAVGFLLFNLNQLLPPLGQASMPACARSRLLRGSFGADAGAIGAARPPMFFNFSPRADLLRGRSHP
jgi:hypothetical protein